MNNLISKELPEKFVSLKYYAILTSSNSMKSSKQKLIFISLWSMQKAESCLITLSKEKDLMKQKRSSSCNKSLQVLSTSIKMASFIEILNLKICCLIIIKTLKLSISGFLTNINQERSSKLHVDRHVMLHLKWLLVKDMNVSTLTYGLAVSFCTQCYVGTYRLKTQILTNFIKRSLQVILKCQKFYLLMRNKF